ncbi:hypothetical protein AM501_06055 [Aneurinibacillus migulanus]|jgi:hypothetical protein|uniref:hypothetical protein n=1 Tax=Aneurinibacillus migulanus TaxID=47500 RepID=UPI0005BC854B|nr:hypothetical protein [Aneurinibacillus migulanus]KIV50924.1 hypothetical protein TS64_25540 [Aneurinibacillus migulanus]KPD09067.1 hypothetical protein AM501_06055 [Aneurinibacillus migulanus]MCP1354970.1 hypothetical protein [Aneurinibacillus migulanus]MED4727560.1 hypothetical protein [Aneurinibacillus migulanus]CEH31689.1 Uncharacterized protein BN1090_A2_04179 [Aneurinibacillus migulanus]
MLNKKIYMVLLFVAVLLLLGGCSASQEDLEYYQKEFSQKSSDAFDAIDNSSKVLAEVRNEASKGMKRTKIMNAVDQGKTALQSMHDDLFNSPVPKEMEEAKETLLQGIKKRIEAHDELFKFYDLQDKQFEQKAEQLLKDSNDLVQQSKAELQKFKK